MNVFIPEYCSYNKTGEQTIMAISSRNTLLAALAFIAFQAQAVNVTVAYQTSAEPAKVAQADNTFAKESGATVDWRKFDSGASIVRALASGDVQIGNLGSSPLAVAASQQVPIEVFLLASKLVQIIRKRYDNNEEEINHNNNWNDALCRTFWRLWK